jgi:hypothetical protein
MLLLTWNAQCFSKVPSLRSYAPGLFGQQTANVRILSGYIVTADQKVTDVLRKRIRPANSSPSAFEELYSTFMLFRCFATIERTKIFALARLLIDFARIETVFA